MHLLLLRSSSRNFPSDVEPELSKNGFTVSSLGSLHAYISCAARQKPQLLVLEIGNMADLDRALVVMEWNDHVQPLAPARYLLLLASKNLTLGDRASRLGSAEVFALPQPMRNLLFKLELQNRLLRSMPPAAAAPLNGFAAKVEEVASGAGRRRVLVVRGPGPRSGSWQENGNTPSGKIRWRWVKAPGSTTSSAGVELTWTVNSREAPRFDDNAAAWVTGSDDDSVACELGGEAIYSGPVPPPEAEKDERSGGRSEPFELPLGELSPGEAKPDAEGRISPDHLGDPATKFKADAAAVTARDGARRVAGSAAEVTTMEANGGARQEPLPGDRTIAADPAPVPDPAVSPSGKDTAAVRARAAIEHARVTLETKRTSAPAAGAPVPSLEPGSAPADAAKEASPDPAAAEHGSAPGKEGARPREKAARPVAEAPRGKDAAPAERASAAGGERPAPAEKPEPAPERAALPADARSPAPRPAPRDPAESPPIAAADKPIAAAHAPSGPEKASRIPEGAAPEAQAPKRREKPSRPPLPAGERADTIIAGGRGGTEAPQRSRGLATDEEAKPAGSSQPATGEDFATPLTPEPAGAPTAEERARITQDPGATPRPASAMQFRSAAEASDALGPTVVTVPGGAPQEDDPRRFLKTRHFELMTLEQLGDRESSWQPMGSGYRAYVSAQHRYYGLKDPAAALPLWIYDGELAPEFIDEQKSWKFYDHLPVRVDSLDGLPAEAFEALYKLCGLEVPADAALHERGKSVVLIKPSAEKARASQPTTKVETPSEPPLVGAWGRILRAVRGILGK